MVSKQPSQPCINAWSDVHCNSRLWRTPCQHRGVSSCQPPFSLWPSSAAHQMPRKPAASKSFWIEPCSRHKTCHSTRRVLWYQSAERQSVTGLGEDNLSIGITAIRNISVKRFRFILVSDHVRYVTTLCQNSRPVCMFSPNKYLKDLKTDSAPASEIESKVA